MRRCVAPLLRLLVFSVAACAPCRAQQQAVPAAAAGPTVFITETGACYHREGCPHLEHSRIPLSLADAALVGYEPCARCRPPAAPGALPPPTGAPAEPYRLNAAGVSSSSEADLRRMTPAIVVRHVDGDTVRVSIPRPPRGVQRHERLRLLGVDTPETVHPHAAVQAFGLQASEFTRERLLHRVVYLAFDWPLRDRYDRLLAYVYLPDGSCHNAELLRAGYAHAYTAQPLQLLEEFRALQAEASREGRGLWASP